MGSTGCSGRGDPVRMVGDRPGDPGGGQAEEGLVWLLKVYPQTIGYGGFKTKSSLITLNVCVSLATLWADRLEGGRPMRRLRQTSERQQRPEQGYTQWG